MTKKFEKETRAYAEANDILNKFMSPQTKEMNYTSTEAPKVYGFQNPLELDELCSILSSGASTGYCICDCKGNQTVITDEPSIVKCPDAYFIKLPTSIGDIVIIEDIPTDPTLEKAIETFRKQPQSRFQKNLAPFTTVPIGIVGFDKILQ